jgi:hypothetical protein
VQECKKLLSDAVPLRENITDKIDVFLAPQGFSHIKNRFCSKTRTIRMDWKNLGREIKIRRQRYKNSRFGSF